LIADIKIIQALMS